MEISEKDSKVAQSVEKVAQEVEECVKQSLDMFEFSGIGSFVDLLSDTSREDYARKRCIEGGEEYRKLTDSAYGEVVEMKGEGIMEDKDKGKLEQVAKEAKEDIEGVNMIQYLLKLNGGGEPREVSLENWRKMSREEKESTRRVYSQFVN